MFEQHIPFAVIVLAIVIGNLVKAVPITPGGMGTYELALAGVFTSCGSPVGDGIPHCGYRSPDQKPRHPGRGDRLDLLSRGLGDPKH